MNHEIKDPAEQDIFTKFKVLFTKEVEIVPDVQVKFPLNQI